MRKRIAILGSTGSIGVNTLDVVGRDPERFEVVGLTAGNNIDLLEDQIRRFHPKAVAVYNEAQAERLKKRIGDIGIEIHSGQEGLIEISILPEVQLVISAIVGAAGLIPTISAIKGGKDVALANKETLVMAGEIVMRLVEEKGVNIIPVDSEHSAIFQSLRGEKKGDIKRLILTASGGPFHDMTISMLEKVSPKDALKHPNWNMGKKITIDSATLMNKGLEVIEARWIFGVDACYIDVLIHHQSIVHSLVEFIDGSIIAQLGIPDMRIPISYALNYPNRVETSLPSLDLSKIGKLTFEKPDIEKFPSLKYAFHALDEGETMPAVLNAANEVAVQAFLKEEIAFTDIPNVILKTMDEHRSRPVNTLEDVLEADRWARDKGGEIIRSKTYHLNDIMI